MPFIGIPLTPGSVGDSVAELHLQLMSVGAWIHATEESDKSYGSTTASAVSAFRQHYGLAAGDMVDLPAARLMYVASQFNSRGDHVTQRAAIEEVKQATIENNQPEELYSLAQFATRVGAYDTAQSLASLIPDHQGVKAVIEPILELPVPAAPQPRPPEVPYPENFYTYRRPWVDPAAVDHVASDFSRLVLEPPSLAIEGGVPAALNALRYWHEGNTHFERRRYAAAVAAYDACQDSVADYFDKLYSVTLPTVDRRERLVALIKRLYIQRESRVAFWSFFQRRRELLSLSELAAHDRITEGTVYDSASNFVSQQIGPGFFPNFLDDFRQRNLEAPLVTLAFVLVPLARAEANRARRQYDEAIRDLLWVVNSIAVERIGSGIPRVFAYARLECEFIELPFAKLLLAESMLDKAEAEYKARTVAAPPPARQVPDYQELKAAQTYLEIRDRFVHDGQYVPRVEASRQTLAGQIEEHLATNDTQSREFQLLGKDILVPTVSSFGPPLPGLDRRAKAHEPLLKFTPADESHTVMRETNPRVYAVLLTATARLEQLKAGFNYLGYLDGYVPPWRFHFLLERARYFAEHAKNSQRDYLNFLANSEREEFQELSGSQMVEMEKSNIRIETARVDQVRQEVEAVRLSKIHAQEVAQNADQRFSKYLEFDKRADDLAGTGKSAGILKYSVIGYLANELGGTPGEILNDISTGIVDFFTQGSASRAIDRAIASEQREYEKFSLNLTAQEAARAAEVAGAQLNAAKNGLIVAGLQRQAALMRHEFALQNLSFLRNRVLNAEQWYRLANAIRSISETYLRYAVELAFLAEQAYEFEADKRINVIRFDYDFSEVGDFLAADFLIRDLATLEQDLIITQRNRHQRVRYVLSMARDFPEALQQIRDSGTTTFGVRLAQIERRFPGLYNLRIGSVEVLPIALLDSTRFTMELTHLGTSQTRLKAQPDVMPGQESYSPLNANTTENENALDLFVPENGWLANLQQTWPIKIRLSGSETFVFSGLTRQDAQSVFPFMTSSQLGAFEMLGAASTWKVDFNARENQIVPGSLADLILTFTLSGYCDPELREEVNSASEAPRATTSWLFGSSNFPDAFYKFNRSGRMTWNVTREMLTVANTLGQLRNVGVLLLPGPIGSNYMGRVMCQRKVRFRFSDTSATGIEILNENPRAVYVFANPSNPLEVTARVNLHEDLPSTAVSWDFGDGSPREDSVIEQGAHVQRHPYAKPGKYIVTLRIERNRRFTEFRAQVAVSRTHHELKPPVAAYPEITRAPGSTLVECKVGNPFAESFIVNWKLGERDVVRGSTALFPDLSPSEEYTLNFTAIRQLKALVSCSEQAFSEGPVEFNGLSLATNRRFDVLGTEVTGVGENPPPNAFTKYMFGETGGDSLSELSPVNEWTFEFPIIDDPINPSNSFNLFLKSVSSSNVEQYGWGEIEEVVLVLEYENVS